MLGLPFGLSQGRENDWIHRLTPILRNALAQQGMPPEGDSVGVATSELAQAGGADLVLDDTERRRQRPQDKDAPKEPYSGKKSPHG